ncbi:hypothetical protein C8R42DRAFT_717960 [Lentinula raphanica]|nr:hypothetical protein C8R42DRAFT_717960 [Lentinula raphanica]
MSMSALVTFSLQVVFEKEEPASLLAVPVLMIPCAMAMEMDKSIMDSAKEHINDDDEFSSSSSISSEIILTPKFSLKRQERLNGEYQKPSGRVG